MGTPRKSSMYTVFSKGFAKKATDLNKRDFLDKYSQKITAKSSNALTTFELEASDTPDRDTKEYNDAKLTVGVPVDDMFTVSLCHKGNGESEVSTAVKLSDAASMTVAIENPDLGLATTSACVDFTYL